MGNNTNTLTMKSYIIDGNNLIFKIKSLEKLVNNDKQAIREKLAYMVNNFFYGRKVNVTLHFDGYENIPLKLPNMKIIYSMNEKADVKIKHQIDTFKNPRNIIVVTSDIEIKNFARVNGCQVLSSLEFSRMLYDNPKKNIRDEKSDISISTKDWEKIFGEK